MTRNCAFSLPDSPEIARIFCKQTRIGIIPTRKGDPNIFLIALKQDYIDAQYVKLPYSMRPFSIFYVLLRKRRQNVQKLNNLKGVYITRRDADQIRYLLFNVTLICCAS